MDKLQESLAKIETGVSEVACAQAALKMISEALDQHAEGERTAVYFDLLHIVTCFLDNAVGDLDAAAGEARAAAETMG